ncbi:hypothetical protein [Novosphingobium sp. ZW T3_23]
MTYPRAEQFHGRDHALLVAAKIERGGDRDRRTPDHADDQER